MCRYSFKTVLFMEISGKVIKVLGVQSFKSRNGEVVKHSFVLETEGDYPKKACLVVMGDERWKKFGIREGVRYAIKFDVDAREWNGRWFNELSVWGAVCVDNNVVQWRQTQAPEPQHTQSPVPEAPTGGQQDSGSQLPF